MKCIKQTFDSKSEFEIQLKKLKLKPILWTRWYNSNWGVILTNGNIADSFISVFIILPIILITTIVFIVRLIRSKFNFKNIYNKIILVIIGIFILRIILDIYPNSIWVKKILIRENRYFLLVDFWSLRKNFFILLIQKMNNNPHLPIPDNSSTQWDVKVRLYLLENKNYNVQYHHDEIYLFG